MLEDSDSDSADSWAETELEFSIQDTEPDHHTDSDNEPPPGQGLSVIQLGESYLIIRVRSLMQTVMSLTTIKQI